MRIGGAKLNIDNKGNVLGVEDDIRKYLYQNGYFQSME